MTENTLDRKLKAIFSADVKGYSRLMGDDEESTIQTLNTYRNFRHPDIRHFPMQHMPP